jgi:hypothetical protein
MSRAIPLLPLPSRPLVVCYRVNFTLLYILHLQCTFFLSGTVRMGFRRFRMGTGTKEDESSAGLVWGAGFHHVTASSRLARVLKLMNRLLFYFPIFFGPQ